MATLFENADGGQLTREEVVKGLVGYCYLYQELMVIDGDPLRDISVLRDKTRIKMVMKGGEAYINNLKVGEPQAVGD